MKTETTAQPARTFETVLSDLSENYRVFMSERAELAELRPEIKMRQAKTRLYVVNGLTEFLKQETADQLKQILFSKNKLTLDTIDALIELELGEDLSHYESLKFSVETSEKAFEMLKQELSGFQSQIKKDALDFQNADYTARMTAQRNNFN